MTNTKAMHPPPPGSPLQLNLNLSKTTTCPRCGGRYFRKVTEVRYFSAVANPTGQEIFAPFELFMCISCGLPIQNLSLIHI